MIKITPLRLTLFFTFAILLLHFIDTPFLRRIELSALDLRFKTRGPIEPSPAVVIAAIDEKSLDQLGKWPWPRDTQSQLVDALTGYDVAAIGFDVVFSEPDFREGTGRLQKVRKQLEGLKSPPLEAIREIREMEREWDRDQVFADALTRSDRTILGGFFHFSDESLGGKEKQKDNQKRVERDQYNAIRFGEGYGVDRNIRDVHGVEINIPLLTEASSGTGFFSFIQDEDGAIRWIPLIVQLDSLFLPPLSMALIREALGEDTTISFNIEQFGVTEVAIEDMTIPTNEKGEMLINYYGRQGVFPTYSIADIINHNVPTEELEGRIVIIGPTAFGIYDLRVTPFQTNYAGVEIHATVIDNILSQRFLGRPSWTVIFDPFAIVIMGFVVGLGTARFSPLMSALLAFLTLSAYTSLAYWLFAHKGVWVNMVYPYLVIFLLFLVITLHRFIAEEQEKRFIKGAFGQYLAPPVIDRLLKNRKQLELGGEEKRLTSFFSDIAGFTQISERLAPKDLVHLINDYLTEMTDIVLDHGGTVDKFMGDSIVAFFGAPASMDDHALKACFAAIDIQNQSKVFQERMRKEGRPEMGTRIGLNTGMMIVGNMGTPRKVNYTVVGDAVNLASRLEGSNKVFSTNIIVGEETWGDVKGHIEGRELDMIRVVGKSEPVRIYEILSRKGELDGRMADVVVLFMEGLAHYRQMEWEKARDRFEKVLRIADDGPARVLLDRTLEYAKKPPGSVWDGVFNLEAK